MIRVVTTICPECPFEGDVDVAIQGHSTFWQCPQCMTLWAGETFDLKGVVRF